jgi:hypothetical protein
MVLHKTPDPITSEGMGYRDGAVFQGMTPRARPIIIEGGECADAHAREPYLSVLEGFTVQADGGNVGDGIKPHAVTLGRDAVV